MADAPVAPGTAPVTDSRRAPRGVMPRGAQTWLMGGLALLVLVIILLTGRTEPPDRPAAAAAAPQTANPGRVRDYQDRLRSLEARAIQEAHVAPVDIRSGSTSYDAPHTPPPEDPIVAEKRRREYESLFASNVVLSRRPASERLDTGRPAPRRDKPRTEATERASPSIEEIADAAVRATVRA